MTARFFVIYTLWCFLAGLGAGWMIHNDRTEEWAQAHKVSIKDLGGTVHWLVEMKDEYHLR